MSDLVHALLLIGSFLALAFTLRVVESRSERKPGSRTPPAGPMA
ncbi:hypothetical protein ACGFMK_20925 [Amycolatopsis sp. NPDC049252]